MEKKIEKEIQDTIEYLKYAIEQIVEKHNFYHWSKVNFTNKKYFNTGDKLLIENPLAKLGVGAIFKETDNYILTRQFNGYQYSKKQYFENKEHSKMVYNGLYCAPYYGNVKLYKEINKIT